MHDQCIPVRDSVPRFDSKRCDDRLWSVDDNLPTQVVLNQLRDLVARQRTRYSATKIHAQLLQNLRTQCALPCGPQMLNQLAGAFVLPTSRAVMGLNQDAGIDENTWDLPASSLQGSTLVQINARKARRATEGESNPGSSRRAVVPGHVAVNDHSSCARERFVPAEPPASR